MESVSRNRVTLTRRFSSSCASIIPYLLRPVPGLGACRHTVKAKHNEEPQQIRNLNARKTLKKEILNGLLAVSSNGRVAICKRIIWLKRLQNLERLTGSLQQWLSGDVNDFGN